MLRKGETGYDPDRDCKTEGYSSYDTWNIALYLEHDRELNHRAKTFMEVYYVPELGHPYMQFCSACHWHLIGKKTIDGVDMSFRNPHLNLDELDADMMKFVEES